MNKYIRALYCVSCGLLKMICIKAFHFKKFNGPLVCFVSPLTEITMDRGAELNIGKNYKMRDGAKLRVRRDAVCKIGDNTSINSNNMLVCREYIEIGDDVQFSPNVQIYDHDHDFRTKGGIKAGKYKTSPVKIGNNVWIGANTVILRGTKIGDNCIIAAGSILKGNYESDTVIIQNRK